MTSEEVRARAEQKEERTERSPNVTIVGRSFGPRRTRRGWKRIGADDTRGEPAKRISRRCKNKKSSLFLVLEGPIESKHVKRPAGRCESVILKKVRSLARSPRGTSFAGSSYGTRASDPRGLSAGNGGTLECNCVMAHLTRPCNWYRNRRKRRATGRVRLCGRQ